MPCKRVKTSNADKEHAEKIADTKHPIVLCVVKVHGTQAFLKDLKVCTSGMVTYIGSQMEELEWVKVTLDEL